MTVVELRGRNGGARVWRWLVAAVGLLRARRRKRSRQVRAVRLAEQALSDHLRRDIGL
jgi:hypothetical protein